GSGRKVDDRALGIPEALDAHVTHVKERNLGAAVTALLDTLDAGADEWLWILHDDSAPLPDALTHLLAEQRKRRRAGVIGATHVRWDDIRRPVNVGVTVSSFGGRRVSLSDLDDLDQGQHHAREDTLAVGLAGALVSRQ